MQKTKKIGSLLISNMSVFLITIIAFCITTAALLEQLVNSTDYRPDLKVFTIVVLTSGDRHKEDISIIDFDPKNLKGEPLGEIEHKIIYICPKYLNKKRTPNQCHEWMEAIEDSLDEQVDESNYTHPEIQQVFDLMKHQI